MLFRSSENMAQRGGATKGKPGDLKVYWGCYPLSLTYSGIRYTATASEEIRSSLMRCVRAREC